MRSFVREFLPSAFVIAGLAVAALAAVAQTTVVAASHPAPVIDGLPVPMTWQNPTNRWMIERQSSLTITAAKKTDWFIDPQDGAPIDNAPRLLFTPADDFVLSAKVNVTFHDKWDSGALVLYVNDTVWAKLCFEMTVDKHPAIVSVVTRGLSDDSTSIPVTGDTVYLKVAKAGQAVFFYASTDGETWAIIRAFNLGTYTDLRAGFSSQAPSGNGCTSVFSQIQYLPGKVDLWTGK
jgi:hypothetical protein